MRAELDHVVLWVEDPIRSLAFFTEIVGFEAIRVEEFREKRALFPSVRLLENAVMAPKAAAPRVNDLARKTANLTSDAAQSPLLHG